MTPNNKTDPATRAAENAIVFFREHQGRLIRDSEIAAIIRKEYKPVVEALKLLMMRWGKTGKPNEDFEERARAFYQATGILAPGKDDRSGAMSHQGRREAFDKWNLMVIESARAILATLESHDQEGRGK